MESVINGEGARRPSGGWDPAQAKELISWVVRTGSQPGVTLVVICRDDEYLRYREVAINKLMVEEWNTDALD